MEESARVSFLAVLFSSSPIEENLTIILIIEYKLISKNFLKFSQNVISTCSTNVGPVAGVSAAWSAADLPPP